MSLAYADNDVYQCSRGCMFRLHDRLYCMSRQLPGSGTDFVFLPIKGRIMDIYVAMKASFQRRFCHRDGISLTLFISTPSIWLPSAPLRTEMVTFSSSKVCRINDNHPKWVSPLCRECIWIGHRRLLPGVVSQLPHPVTEDDCLQ